MADKQLWLMPSSECTDQGTTAPVTRLDRGAFDKWASDTKRLLPKSWQDDTARVNVRSEQIAIQAVTGWERQRRAKNNEWGANPMGLLHGLAKRAGQAAASGPR